MASGGRIIRIPYGTGQETCQVDPGRRITILEARSGPAPAGRAEDIIAAALNAPIASKPLSELAAGRKKAVILTSDHTRPVPSHLTLPPLLAEIRRTSPEAEITILI
ncbi:MAG: lactate racemase domain-containing protein, partial [Deltaproteobacteria bacterium]|nr:lactate racemase domain-containing protein [Deltaproteobacteria bacterium]